MTSMSREMQRNDQYKYTMFLAVFYFVGWAATYPMVYKMVFINGVLETGAIFLFPLSYAIADIITEVYGYRLARQITWIGLICGFIYAAALYFVTAMPSATFWHDNGSYQVVFGKILRAYFSLTLASIVGNFINIYIISKWKIYLEGKHFWLRSLISTCIAELSFTLIGGTLAYAGVQPWSKIIFLMLDGYLFKVLYALIAVWPAFLVATLLKRAEGTDVYDYDISYNPLKFGLD